MTNINTATNQSFDRKYCVAVAHKTIRVDTSSETNDEIKYRQMNRLLKLPEGETFDFFQLVTNTSTVRFKLISSEYFRTEGVISDDIALNRCEYLSLDMPENYYSFAKNEILEDRESALKWFTIQLTHLIVKVAQAKAITHGQSPAKRVVSITGIGKALTECEVEADFEAIWYCMYGLFDDIPTWKHRLEEACLAQFGWKVVDKDIVSTNSFRSNCIHKLASLAINNLRRVVNGFATRKGTPKISIKRPNSMITAENRWKKRVKKVFSPFFVKSDDNAVSILIICIYQTLITNAIHHVQCFIEPIIFTIGRIVRCKTSTKRRNHYRRESYGYDITRESTRRKNKGFKTRAL